MNFPVVIDGVTYYVERTFDGSPAIFQGVRVIHKGHINEKSAKPVEVALTNGVVIILARTVDQTR